MEILAAVVILLIVLFIVGFDGLGGLVMLIIKLAAVVYMIGALIVLLSGG